MGVRRRFTLARRPNGTPVPADFALVEEACIAFACNAWISFQTSP